MHIMYLIDSLSVGNGPVDKSEGDIDASPIIV
jgi:hypothetical protein